MLGDGRLDLDLLQLLWLGNDLFVAEHHRAQADLVALFGAEPIDEQRAALLDLVLLASALDDCVRAHWPFPLWVERDRPRPPLRPRRLLREAPDSSWEPFESPFESPRVAPLLASTPSGSEATAAARSTLSILTSLRWPTKGPPPVTLTM